MKLLLNADDGDGDGIKKIIEFWHSICIVPFEENYFDASIKGMVQNYRYGMWTNANNRCAQPKTYYVNYDI